MSISKKTRKDLESTVVSYLKSAGMNDPSLADSAIESFIENTEDKILALDALASDDLGLVSKNKELQKLYKEKLVA